MKTYAIANIDAPPAEGFFERIEALASVSVDFLQIRARSMPGAPLLRLAQRCREIVGKGPTALVINSRTDVAVACSAAGVHLPAAGVPVEIVRRVAPDMLVGRSCHSAADVRAAAAEGADYVLLGPVFDPRSKEGTGTLSRLELAQAADCFRNVFALGGISLDNLPQLRGTGIAGVAGITLFMVDGPVSTVVEAIRAS